jgi:hypothetical protein
LLLDVQVEVMEKHFVIQLSQRRLMVWRRGKGLDPRRARAAIKLRTASKANGNLHPKELQHLPFLRSFWMVFFSLLFLSHTPCASISGVERKY